MYLDHFGLSSNPFSLAPRIDFVYLSGAFEENMAHLVYGVENSEAVTLITGPIGSGKTLAVQKFLAKLGPEFSFALVTNTQVNSIELLKLILEDLEVETPIGCDKSDLLIIFKKFLLAEHEKGRKILIVIDEAQNLSQDAIEELRLLTNLGQGDLQPVQIVLVGQPELEDIINNPSLVQMRQRIRVHYRLTSLLPHEIENYLNHRMQVAGCMDSVFTHGAIKRIFEFSNGIPRLVNALANAALLSAYVANQKFVDEKDVDPNEAGFPGQEPLTGPDDVFTPPEVVAQEKAVPPPQPQPQPQPKNVTVPEPRTQRTRRPILAFVLVALILIPAGLYFTGNLDDLIEKFNTYEFTETEETAEPPPVEIEQVPVVNADPDTVALLPVEVDKSPSEPVVSEVLLVHVASFQDKDDAENYAEVLRGQDHPSRVKHHMVADQEWYRVFLGPFADEKLALADMEKLKREDGLTYYQLVTTTE
jgi:type II secretory pathway predicted ATPase ExeA/cell division protein FtsN